MLNDFNGYENLDKNSIKSKTLMHSVNFSRKSSSGKVEISWNIDEI